jgi:hypothetical protein
LQEGLRRAHSGGPGGRGGSVADRKGGGLGDRNDDRERWTFIVPVENLVLTDAVSREFEMERVTFVHKDRLPYVRKKHGLGVPVSELKKRPGGTSFFEVAGAFAVVRHAGTREEVERRCLEMVREELHLLSVSRLGYSRRDRGKPAVPKGEDVHSSVSFLSVRGRDSAPFWNSAATSPRNSMVLDWHWKRFQDDVLFTNLCRILRGKTKVKENWRNDLRRAALLIGESVDANDLLKSFIWNIAALETLLLKQVQEKTEDALLRRAEALLGWVRWGEVQDNEGRKRRVSVWELEDFEGWIGNCVRERNRFLHGGKREGITEELLFFTDLLLLNILDNLVRFPKLFPSKDEAIAFSKKLEAERTLDVKPRVRPEGLRFRWPVTIRS